MKNTQVIEKDGTVRTFRSQTQASEFYGKSKSYFAYLAKSGFESPFNAPTTKRTKAPKSAANRPKAQPPKERKAAQHKRRQSVLRALQSREGQVDLVAQGILEKRTSKTWRIPIEAKYKDEDNWTSYKTPAHFAVDVGLPDETLSGLVQFIDKEKTGHYQDWKIRKRYK